MFSDILQRFLNFGAIFSLYSVEMETSKYTKFRHASMCGSIKTSVLQLAPRYAVPRAHLLMFTCQILEAQF